MARRSRIRLSQIKVPIKHSDTNITTHGGGTVPGTFNVMETEGGSRTVSGVTKTIKDNASTGELCNVGDQIKYVNLFIECAPRSTATTPAESMGHIEWAFLCVKESETTVPLTQLGVQTLGDVCTNMFRNECIFTGNMPIGLNQPNSSAIVIKIPKFKQKIRMGDEWRFVHWFRSWDSTNDDLNNIKTIKSFNYKCYS